jgi:hypothetical protein
MILRTEALREDTVQFYKGISEDNSILKEELKSNKV